MNIIVPKENSHPLLGERRFYALDFDRCIGDTEKLAKLFEDIVTTRSNVSRAQLYYARRACEAEGISFDGVGYIKKRLRNDQFDFAQLIKDFCLHGRRCDMLMPSAHRLINGLAATGASFGFVTYGGYDWQRAKLRASRLEQIPALITDNPTKGRLIATWWDEGGQFNVPIELRTHIPPTAITLIDDNPASFEGLPSTAQGICVRSSRYNEIAIGDSRIVVADDLEQACNILGLPS